MKELIDSMRKYFSEKNRGFYISWDIGYCNNCSEIVFITGTEYRIVTGEDCLGTHYGTASAGTKHCSECQSTKYIPLENFLTGEELAVPYVITLFDKSLKKFRNNKFVSETLFNLYDKDGAFRGEIDKWLALTHEERVSILNNQRKLKEKIREVRKLRTTYAFE